MANYTKLNMASGPRKAVLRNQVTALLWNGRIETTDAKAREVRRIAEKMITKAMKQYKNTVTVTKSVKDDKGNIVEKEFVNDAPEKLAVRRQMLAYLYNVKPEKLEKESNTNTISAQGMSNILLWKKYLEKSLRSMQPGQNLWARAAAIPASSRWGRDAAMRRKW